MLLSFTIQVELAKQAVVLGHGSLSFKDLNQHTRLVVRIWGECLNLLVGIVVFRSINLAIRPPAVSRPMDSGVASNRKTSCTAEKPLASENCELQI